MYLDKKDRLIAWFTPWRTVVVAAVFLVVLFAPVWPRFVAGRAALEPIRRETVRTAVPGDVVAVFVREGDHVAARQPLIQLRAANQESLYQAAEKNLATATAEQINTQLQYADTGKAAEDRRQYAVELRAAAQGVASLTPTAPIPGVITTNGINSLRGTYLQSGATVAEIADLSTMRARIFVPEFEVSEVHRGQPVRVLVENRIRLLSGQVEAVLPAATALAAGLESPTEYKGLADTRYYVVEVLLPNDGELRDQMSGTAKIRIGWQSIAGVVGRNLQEFIGRKFW